MDSSEKSNSSSHSIQEIIANFTEDENFQVVPAKKIKLTTSSGDLTRKGITEDVTETASMNTVLIIPNSSFSREEFVFSIDHILESIFMKCDRRTVLNCRLVSRRWAVFGSKELQKTFCIKFMMYYRMGERILRFISQCGKTGSMEDVTALMNNSTEFPCSITLDFQHDKEQTESDEEKNERDKVKEEVKKDDCNAKGSNMEIVEAFLNAHGACVKEIFFRHVILFKDLKHILLNQALNLQHLYLGRIDLIFDNYTDPDESDNEEQESELERQRLSLFDETTLKPKPILKNLKVFECHSGTYGLDIFIQQILEISPNLVNIALRCHHLHFVVQPTNRVHLLKKLNMYLCNSNIESIDLFANHLQDNDSLAVRELYFDGADYDEDDEDEDVDNEEFDKRVFNVMRKILYACSATCRKLVWHKGVNQLEFPQMPLVEHLTIVYYKDDEETWVPVHSLGEGVSLAFTFPSLQSVEIITRVGLSNLALPKIFNDEDHIAAAKVQKVTLRMPFSGKRLLQGFKDMFPNATFWKKGMIGADGYDEYEFNDDESDGESVDHERHDGESDDSESIDDENEDGESGDEENEDGESGDEENEDGESGDEENGDGESGDEESEDGESNDEENDDDGRNEKENIDDKSDDGESKYD